MTVSHCSSVVSESGASHSTPAFRMTVSSPPSRLCASSTDASTVAASRTSGARTPHPWPRRHAAACAVAPAEDDARALGGEQPDDRLADARRAAGDEDALIGVPRHSRNSTTSIPVGGTSGIPLASVMGPRVPHAEPIHARTTRLLRPLVLAVAVACRGGGACRRRRDRRSRSRRSTRRSPRGRSGWTSTPSCAPLCSVANAVDPNAGASEPGSAAVIYTSLGGLLGGLAAGTSTWTSPSFTWTNAPPGACHPLVRAQGRDRRPPQRGRQRPPASSCTTSPPVISRRSRAERSPPPRARSSRQTFAVDPGLLRTGHAYRLLITTSLPAAALLSGIRVWPTTTSR